MRLKWIEIIGFKSFADKTKLRFDEGVTAIVGPNGCGKSNISDAFRWVLGEQSAKSMRGSKMPDVIFAGTASRKPLNYAEVTITLTDIQGQLPIEYEEVSITRRLHRSGESDYFINRHPVRLKDVQSLFLDSGMGKDAYSIFEQGKIDQVINFTPIERRYIFEEAAGILRFLQRKKEALRKLEQTDLNVARVKDIHQEVEKQIQVLEEQAEKARLYKENKSHLENLEKGLLVLKWEQLQKKQIEIKTKGDGHQKNGVILNQQLEAFSIELKESKALLADGEKNLRVKSEEAFKARGEKEIKSKEKISNEERLKDTLAKEKRWQQELETMIHRRKTRQEESKELEKKSRELKKEIDSRKNELELQRSKVHEIEKSLHKLRDKQQGKQNELLEFIQSQSKAESLLKQSSVRMEAMLDKILHYNKRRDVLSHSRVDMQKQLEEKEGLLKESSKEIDSKRKDFVSMESALNELAQEIQKNQGLLNHLSQELAEVKARQKVLKKLQEERVGFSAGSKRLLEESEKPQSPLHKKIKGLYEYLIPVKGYEKALAAVMRTYAQTLVVKTVQDFNEVIAFATQNKLKDFSLFCLESSEPAKTTSASFVMENEVSTYFVEGTSVVKELSEGIKLLKKKIAKQICTEDGTFLDHRMVLFDGVHGENNVIIREAELKTLETKLNDLETSKQELESVLKNLQQKRNQTHHERLELDKIIRRDEMKLVEINYTVQRIKQDLEKSQAEWSVIEQELTQLTQNVEILKEQLAELQSNYKHASEKVVHLQSSMGELNENLRNQVETQRSNRLDLQGKESLYQKILEEQRRCEHALHVSEIKDQESLQQEKRLEEEIESCRALQSHIQIKGSEFEKMLRDVESNLVEVLAACSENEQEVAARKVVIEHIEKKIEEKRLQLKKSDTEHHQVGIQLAQTDSTLSTLELESKERYQSTIEELQEEMADFPLEISEKEIRSLRQELENAGDINMTSIEECEKHKNRHQFLDQQLGDLNGSKKELIEIITQLDDESRKVFKQTFEKISKNFKKNFQILFNGGEADLHFTESNDVLESGIEIIAKPPGKQMRSINLLSGGEKCLTALALLFAIFEVKPAPFCILDEIDAPLDDTNVERFSNIVKQYINRCQFIIITHNKRTMAIADVLFGVSMEEKGVSKLLAMEFAKQTTPEPVLEETYDHRNT